ncbi:MAG: permease-like cell division protein FtsX [Candidatus Scatovivens sp.]
MGYSGVSYLIVEGFKNVFKNKKSSMASLLTMLCAMFLFGAFFAMGENINHVVEQVEKSQGIEVFIRQDATEEEIEEIGEKINKLDGINTVKFKNKQQALEQMKEQLKDEDGKLFKAYEGENNIFPTSYVITLTDLSLSQSIQEVIKKWDNIDEVASSDQTIDTLIKISNGIRIAIGVIFALLLLIAITIISNTIKLTVHARRKEISIMKYVGATNNFIRGPFIVEGILIGIFAALITIIVLSGLYNLIITNIESSNILQKMGVNLLQFSDIINSIIIVFLCLGIGIGIIGSSISMKKYLEV